MIWLVIGIGVFAPIGALGYLSWYMRWEAAQTAGMAYYGRTLAERRDVKEQIQRRSGPIRPLVRLLALFGRKRAVMPTFEFEGVYGPPKVSSPAVFERAKQYQPKPEDVFVVTQMRCGTTWMQQLVYQVVTRGLGEFGAGAGGHLYAISPWIDAVNSVSIEEAPIVGARPTRIIKSHLPTSLCPYSTEARYIYVTRHPVSCFASIVDYNRSLLGPLMPPVTTVADWFCSDRMYWLPWPRHVTGWWQWSQTRDNVLFVHFEEMTEDFSSVRNRVERFLGCTLMADEQARVTERCSFQYMKAHEEVFEMSPPTMFSVMGGRFMTSGKSSRQADVTPAIRARILDYCRNVLRERDYPARLFYPDLGVEPGGGIQSMTGNGQVV